MGRGGRFGSKLRSKRKVPSEDKGLTDESDEDYMVAEEEFADSEDYYDESEQSLGDSEEEEGKKKVKKGASRKGRKPSFGRKRDGVERSRARKRVSYEEDDDEDYIDDGGAGEFEEEKRVAIAKRRNNSFGRKRDGVERSRSRKRVSYEEDDDDEDYMDDGGAGEFEKEKTVAIAKRRNDSFGRKRDGVERPRTIKRVSYKEDDDDDYDVDGGAGEFEDEGRNNSFGRKKDGVERSRTRKRVSYEEDYDGDYIDDGCAGEFEDEEEKTVGIRKGRNNPIGRKKDGVDKPHTSKRVSYREDDEDEDYIGDGCAGEFEDEEENTVGITKGRKNPIGRKQDGVDKPQKRKRGVSYREDDDEDYDVDGGAGEFEDGEEEEEEEKIVAILKGKKNSLGRKKDGIGRRKGVLYREDDDDDYDVDSGAGEFEDGEEEEVKTVATRQKNSFGRKKDGIEKSHRRKGVLYSEDDDDDYDVDSGAGEYEDEEEEEVKTVAKRQNNSFGRKKDGVEKPHRRKRVSYREDGDDEDYDVDGGEGGFEDEDEDEEKEMKKAAILKGRKDFVSRKKDEVKRDHSKKRASQDEEDYEEYYNDEDYDDDDGDDDDDDDEFMPDDIDCVDDEDELGMRKKNKKLSRPPSRGRGSIKRGKRKRKTNSNSVKKPMRKRPRRSLASGRKSGADIVGEFIDKKSVLRDRSKKSSGHRRKLITHSDSDFVSSGSSDFEYTVSEEERQQVREASEFCRKLSTNLRSSTLSHNTQEEEKVSCQQRKRLRSKGKEKVEELKNVAEAVKQVCGICLSEEGKKSVRGTLNCCSHYFCFDCIMEWSKVESRCPLCKQRFTTISKPARSNAGFDLRTAVIQVPERDQVYQPSEEELRGYLDPYESVICTECLQGGDDALMLLCDLCDSSAHTYCVGLGHEVPEGNWYCEGCRPTAIGSSTPQATNPTTNLIGESSPVEDIGIGFDLNVMYVPDTPLTQGSASLGSPGSSIQDNNQASSPVLRAGAVTVSERRRIQRRIQHLLHSRINMLRGRTSSSGTDISSSQVDQPRVPSETAAPRHTSYERMIQDNPTHHARAFQGPSSTSSNAEVHGINIGVSSRSSYEIHPCSSRSNYGSEATAPSRTLQGPPHTPF